MFRLFVNILVALLTFAIGVSMCGLFVTHTSIEDISKDSASYNGRIVEIESYLSLNSRENDGQEWMLGEPFEKPEAWTYLDIKTDTSLLIELRNKLAVNLPERQYNRAKVVVVGRVTDNCLSSTCCFGRSITIDVSSITQTGPVELYSVPYPFNQSRPEIY